MVVVSTGLNYKKKINAFSYIFVSFLSSKQHVWRVLDLKGIMEIKSYLLEHCDEMKTVPFQNCRTKRPSVAEYIDYIRSCPYYV